MPNTTTASGAGLAAEQARIESVWLADSWRYYDHDLAIFAGVMFIDTRETLATGKPWQLHVAFPERAGLTLPEKSWHATADEAKAVLSAAVLDLWAKQATA